MVQFTLHDFTHSIQDSISTLTNCLCKPQTSLKLNGRAFKIVKLLGEGGFSYVYLAQDASSGRMFALKKIRCPLGADSVKEAMKEVEAYRRFRHPNIIRCLDSCVVQDKDTDGKVDLVNSRTGLSPLPEEEILTYFLGVVKAVQAMHKFVPTKKSKGSNQLEQISDSYPPSGLPATPSSTSPTQETRDRKGKGRQNDLEDQEEEDEDEDGFQADGKTEQETQEEPLMGNHSSHATVQEDALSHEDAAIDDHSQATSQGAIEPWAHRDLKPANVMISDDGQPILMDFGSAIKARIQITNRSIALQQQDLAAEHSSMPYRAPELFDVKTGKNLTEAVDIWSLGCCLYCLAYGHSPFETSDTIEQGGSMALAVMNGSWKFPNNTTYSESFKNLIKQMLVLEPDDRINVDQLIIEVQNVIDQSSDA